MCAAPDAAMSGLWHRVFRVLYLVTKFFGYITSKDRGMCGRVQCMPFIMLGGVCLWLGVCVHAGVVIMIANMWH